MQQNISSAGRAHAEKRSNDSRCRHRGLQHVGFEPLIQKIDGAHRHQLHLVVFVFRGQTLKAAAKEQQVLQSLWIERSRIWRCHAHDGLHKVGHLEHRLSVFVVSFGIEL